MQNKHQQSEVAPAASATVTPAETAVNAESAVNAETAAIAAEPAAAGSQPAQAPAATRSLSGEEIDALISSLVEQAEQRGYLRARNEIAQAVMNRPRLWENPLRSRALAPQQTQAPAVEASSSAAPAADDDIRFLSCERPNVWD